VLDEPAECHGAQVFTAEADRQTVRGRVLFGSKCSVNARRQCGPQGRLCISRTSQCEIAANKAAIAANSARFGQLDDYYILDEERKNGNIVSSMVKMVGRNHTGTADDDNKVEFLELLIQSLGTVVSPSRLTLRGWGLARV
jgi:hypothetical protein